MEDNYFTKNNIMWQDTGFMNVNSSSSDAIDKLELHLHMLPAKYRQYNNEQLLYKPAPDKWSKQEILGHLIDSAINNLKRFTEIQFLPQPYIITPYQQNELVAVNNYQALPLLHLLQVWIALNQQIIFVVNTIPVEKLRYNVQPQYNNKEMKTLDWLIGDYVAHLAHHFKQVLGT